MASRGAESSCLAEFAARWRETEFQALFEDRADTLQHERGTALVIGIFALGDACLNGIAVAGWRAGFSRCGA
jgi:hypothetical protein